MNVVPYVTNYLKNGKKYQVLTIKVVNGDNIEYHKYFLQYSNEKKSCYLGSELTK